MVCAVTQLGMHIAQWRCPAMLATLASLCLLLVTCVICIIMRAFRSNSVHQWRQCVVVVVCAISGQPHGQEKRGNCTCTFKWNMCPLKPVSVHQVVLGSADASRRGTTSGIAGDGFVLGCRSFVQRHLWAGRAKEPTNKLQK